MENGQQLIKTKQQLIKTKLARRVFEERVFLSPRQNVTVMNEIVCVILSLLVSSEGCSAPFHRPQPCQKRCICLPGRLTRCGIITVRSVLAGVYQENVLPGSLFC